MDIVSRTQPVSGLKTQFQSLQVCQFAHDLAKVDVVFEFVRKLVPFAQLEEQVPSLQVSTHIQSLHA
ncbi:hypothetical protein D9M71_330000 [compost metagenome]